MKEKKITGNADYLDEIELSENKNTKLYACVKKNEPVKMEVEFSNKLMFRTHNKRILTGNPDSQCKYDYVV